VLCQTSDFSGTFLGIIFLQFRLVANRSANGYNVDIQGGWPMEKMLLPASVPCFADTAIYTYEVFKGESHEFT
jgi:hypothetical protein